MGDQIMCVGVDDGYAETKIVLPTGKRIRLPSRARAGESNHIVLQSGQAASIFGYSTDEGSFVAGDVDESDATAFDDYPVSAMNRVVVAHALRQAGVEGGEVSIATGLPVRRYYRRQTPNEKLIQAKKDNLLKNDVVASDGTALPKIVSHEVVAEGIAAWIDHVMQRDANGKLQVNSALAKERIGIIDIGGRTTDIAVVRDWIMDANRSSTIDVGMIAIQQTVQELLEDEYETSLSDMQVLAAVQSRAIRLWGKTVDVSAAVEHAEQTVVSRIRAEALQCLGSAADLDQVIFVGGTSVALQGHLNGWFRHQSVGADPAFANARGLQKCAEYLG